MQKIKNRNIAQLLMQLGFAPVRKRRKQLDAAEKLLAIIDKDKEYPFEFICFKITEFNPKTSLGEELIKGDELIEDLRMFVAKLSAQVAQSVAEQIEKIYSIEELAENFGVSTKTINRWRKRGLSARKFIFDDGKKRFAFSQSAVDKFLEDNPNLISNAQKFARLTNKEKQQIIKEAFAIAAKGMMSRYQIIEQIAAKIGKVHETVRYTIINYEKANPDRPIFGEPPGAIGTAEAAELYKLYRQGDSIEELMKRFSRSKSSIYRIINRRRAKDILLKKVEFIDSNEFLEEDAEEKILSRPFSSATPELQKIAELLGFSGGSLDDYLQKLKNTLILNREQEVELFRRYNYLKYLACVTRAGIKPARVLSERLKKIEDCLAEAEVIKKMIIEANLRLVVSIARKHSASGANLADLVSEGNISLMRAVEKFDYTKGFRFATYASWAIAKDFARKIPAEAARPDKAPTASLAGVDRDLRATTAAGAAAVEQAHRSLVQVIKDNLNEREQYVILKHFGLVGSLIRKERKTLKEIGQDLGLSKERVRQIELVALQKLRHSLSIEEFELLTG